MQRGVVVANVRCSPKKIRTFGSCFGDFSRNLRAIKKNVGDFPKNVGDFSKNVGDFSENVPRFF